MTIKDGLYEKIIEVGNEIFTVLSLSRVLKECDGSDDELKNSDRQVLIRLLSEKAVIMDNKFNDLELFAISNYF